MRLSKTIRALCKRSFETQASFETRPYDLYILKDGPPKTAILTREDGLKAYRQMVDVRRLENASAQLYRDKTVRGFCHLYAGQEAVAVGVLHASKPGDAVITSYRAHGWTYLMGVSVYKVIAELAQKFEGCTMGKGGSMHMYANNFYGGNGIVGAQVPLGLGIALALQYEGKNNVCYTVYGDGAANQGQIFETFNIAALRKIPCIFMCENNIYGMGTSVERHAALTDFYKRGHYIPGIKMDGMEYFTVREGMRFARDWALKNSSPIVIECLTYRYFGHSMSDPGTSYRDNQEISEVRQTRDPITTLREKLLSSNMCTKEEIAKIDNEAKKTVADAVASVRKLPQPEQKYLAADVYAEYCGASKIRGLHPFQHYEHLRVGKSLHK